MSTALHRVSVGGLEIAYHRVGRGRPLILLHGNYCDSRAWRWQLDGLADKFTVVAWDAPGFGASDDPPENFDYSPCLAAFMTELGLGPANVLGLSFGSVLALQLYRDRPELVDSLILASAYAGWAGSLPAEVVAQRMTQTLASAEQPPAQLAAAFIPTLMADTASPQLYAEVEKMVMEFHPAGVRAMTHAFGPPDVRSVLPTITVPTLLIYGDRDVRSPLGVAHDIASRIKGVRLAVIEGVGHLCNAEAPERFNAEVRSFLTSQ